MSSSMREVATLSGDIAADPSVSFVRWQHGEQTVAGWVLSFVFFGLCADTTTHLMSLMLCRWVRMIFWVFLYPVVSC